MTQSEENSTICGNQQVATDLTSKSRTATPTTDIPREQGNLGESLSIPDNPKTAQHRDIRIMVDDAAKSVLLFIKRLFCRHVDVLRDGIHYTCERCGRVCHCRNCQSWWAFKSREL